MPVSRVKRQLPHIDMAAMSDVAFLLLTFFILCGRPHNFNQSVDVNLPTASSLPVCSMIENEILTVYIKENKVFIGLSSPQIQQKTLLAMAVKHHLSFSKEELKKFSHIENFGDPIYSIKGFIEAHNHFDEYKFLKGIPIDDTKNNQLFNWIYEARAICKQQTDSELHIAIACDPKEQYPLVKQVIANLQRQDINKFSLMAIQKNRGF